MIFAGSGGGNWECAGSPVPSGAPVSRSLRVCDMKVRGSRNRDRSRLRNCHRLPPQTVRQLPDGTRRLCRRRSPLVPPHRRLRRLLGIPPGRIASIVLSRPPSPQVRGRRVARREGTLFGKLLENWFTAALCPRPVVIVSRRLGMRPVGLARVRAAIHGLPRILSRNLGLCQQGCQHSMLAVMSGYRKMASRKLC